MLKFTQDIAYKIKYVWASIHRKEINRRATTVETFDNKPFWDLQRVAVTIPIELIFHNRQSAIDNK